MSLNIRSGRARGPETALRALQQCNSGINVLQETQLMDRIYKRNSDRYSVWETDTERRHWVRIAIAWLWEEGCHLEGETDYGPRMKSFNIMAGHKRWYVISAYGPANDQPMVLQVEHALACCPAQT